MRISRPFPAKRFAEEIFGEISRGIVCAPRDAACAQLIAEPGVESQQLGRRQFREIHSALVLQSRILSRQAFRDRGLLLTPSSRIAVDFFIRKHFRADAKKSPAKER
jgi:hypothetical protein